MDSIIPTVQDGTKIQHPVFDGTVCALKWIFSSLPGESKESASAKKLLAGEGDWNCVKKSLGWTVDREAGTVSLPERKLLELLTLMDFPATQLHMDRKGIERLLGKLHSIHLTVPGAVAHLYQNRRDMSKGVWTGPGCRRPFINKLQTGGP